jgi:hypothetical protein
MHTRLQEGNRNNSIVERKLGLKPRYTDTLCNHLRRRAKNDAKNFVLIIVNNRHNFGPCLLVPIQSCSGLVLINKLLFHLLKP